ncbi:DMT family transporter [Patescibacteria group bacterium]|nr:DMT family transporter [Patescibacteria group bacterium]
MSDTAKGLRVALFAAFISGVSIFLNKFATASLDHPLILPTIKNTLVGLFFTSFLIGSHQWQKIKSLKRKQVGQLILIGVIGGALPFYLFFSGLAQIPAVNAAIIHKSLIIWVTLLAMPLLKERLSKLQAAGVLALFAGNLWLGGFGGLTFSPGELMVLGATLLWAIETIVAKKALKELDPQLLAAARMGLGSVILIGISLITAPAELASLTKLDSVQWTWIGLTTISLVGYVYCWYFALKHASAISVSAVLVVATLITNLLSAIFITHTWNLTLTHQGCLLLAGTAIFVLPLVYRVNHRLSPKS